MYLRLGLRAAQIRPLGSMVVACKESQIRNQATSAVTFDSSDSFMHMITDPTSIMCHHLLNNGERRFTEKVIHVQEMDSMGTASKNLSREV